MSEVFQRNHSVFFIGGTGTKAGIATPGGCTKDFYDANIAASGDLTKIMGANGGAFFTENGVETTNTGVTTVTASANMESAGVLPGMCVFCVGNGFIAGIYEILSVTSNVFTIHIDALGTPGPGGLGNIFVGGAFATVQQALDDTTGALGFNTWVLINKADDAVGRTMAQMGDLGTNSHWYLWGFNTTPPTNLFEPTGDQDYGGAYYKSALDILNQGGLAYHTLGSELVANGDFANWSADDPVGWTVLGESGSDPEVSEVGNGEGHGGSGIEKCNFYTSDATEIAINQTITLVTGRKYTVSINVDTIITGALTVRDIATNMFSDRTVDTTGVDAFTFVATATSMIFRIGSRTATGACDITIDNVSVKEVLIPAKVRLSVSNASDLFTITNGENIHFRNLDLVGHTSQDIFNLSGTAIGCSIRECLFNNYDNLIDSGQFQLGLIRSCYIGEPATDVDVTTGPGSLFENCIFDLKAKAGLKDFYWSIISCIFIGGTRAIAVASLNTVKNCIMYGQTVSCVAHISASAGIANYTNNIFIPAAGAKVIEITAAGGSVNLFAHNLMWGADGNQVSNKFDNDGTPFTPFGGGNIEEDPLFVSVTPGAYDFRSRNPRVLRGGQQTIAGEPTQMGAVLQKHQFDLRNIS